MNLISLAKRYDLVVGDRFEMFYRGVIKSLNPYKYYIHVSCKKGRAYPRYYTFTPNESDVGDVELILSLYDDYHNLIEQATTTLHIVKAVKPSRTMNILCFGDSLTVNGVWPYTGYHRFCEDDPEFSSQNFGKCLNFVGTQKKENVGYVAFGGWKWSEFCKNDAVGMRSSVWVTCEHHLDENDQESFWQSDGKNWILETIEEKRLKFKRGDGNFSCGPNIGKTFVNTDGGVHKEDIEVISFQYEETNPFWSENLQGPSIKEYCDKNGYPELDFIYILLSWNGQYIPYNEDFSMHETYIRMFLDGIKKEYPNCKVGLIGIQSPAINGGITANYGCYGVYSDTLGDIVTAYNYDMFLEKLCELSEYCDFCRYIDMKAQFDVEHSTPAMEQKVNNRSNIKELIGTNGVHPTMEGYLQIGDAFYRALVSDLEEKERK